MASAIFGEDAHDTEQRTPRMAEARELVAQRLGKMRRPISS